MTRQEQTKRPSLWSISVFGGPPYQLVDEASGASLSPDGLCIAFLRGDLSSGGYSGRQVWVMRSDGTDVVEVAGAKSDGSTVEVPTWSADGKSIAYIRANLPHVETRSIEVNEWQKRNAQTVFANSHLMSGLYWLRDGRLLYALREGQDSSVWTLPLQQYPNPKISGSSNLISRGPGWVHSVSGSLDGRVVTVLRGNWGPSVFIGTLAANGTHLLANQRLTLDENESWPVAWTPDSKAVLFHSDRNGRWEIFRQLLDAPSPESLWSSAEQLRDPRLTPDGSEVLYLSNDVTNISTPEFAGLEAPSSIFAIPIDGGTPRLVFRDVAIWNVQCARSPSAVCMYSIRKGNTSSETFRFDVRTGKRIGPSQTEPLTEWSLSPDGSQRAIVTDSGQARIQLRPTSAGKPRDVVVKGWKGISSIDWSADGKSLLVAWHNNNWESALLNVTLDGSASVLLKLRGTEVWYAIPSPDGRFVAISETTDPWNVWQIENF
jgi:Tol biopolymer transport system component